MAGVKISDLLGSEDFPKVYDDKVFHGRSRLIHYLRKEFESYGDLLSFIIPSGNLKAIKYVFKYIKTPKISDFLEVIKIRNDEIYQLLKTKSYLTEDGDLYFVALGIIDQGNLADISWFFEREPVFHPEFLDRAAHNLNSEVILWLVDKNCPRTSETTCLVAELGDLDLLKVLIDLGFPVDQNICEKLLEGAIETRYSDCLEWLWKRYPPNIYEPKRYFKEIFPLFMPPWLATNYPCSIKLRRLVQKDPFLINLITDGFS